MREKGRTFRQNYLSGDNYYTHQIVLRINGGTTDVLPVENTNFWLIMPSTGGSASGSKNQFLYSATELGTKGSIGSMWVRLNAASSAATYSNFSVVMGSTTNLALGSTFSGSLSGATTVFNGPLVVPAGMLAGDWLEIPFSSAYTYDGVSNLVIQFKTDPGSVGTAFKGSSSATIYPSRYSYAMSSSTDAASVISGVLSLRLKVSK